MLPNPCYEKEITTHLTLWREKKELNLAECARNCQEAENVSIAPLYTLTDNFGDHEDPERGAERIQ